jgi:hypothetical protein
VLSQDRRLRAIRFPVHLGQLDRGRVAATFDQMARSISGYEASAEVTTFTSKFEAVLAHKAQLTQEQAGNDLFRGRAQCNSCHRRGGPGEDPLFTDFTASNIGIPANRRLPYYVGHHPTRWAMSPIRQLSHLLMVALAVSSPRVLRSANPARWIRNG